VLRQAEDGTSVEEVCRKTGISQATFYAWKRKYGGLMPSEMKRLRQLEEENGRLKRMSKDLDLWAYARGVELDFSRPGKPTDNAFIESLNGKFRAECLSAHWFLNLADAQRKCEALAYNDVRPHSAIGYETPSALAKRSPATSPP
jgi:putative transposase